MPRGAAIRAARALAPRSGPSHSGAVYRCSYGGRRWLHNSTAKSQEVLATAAKLPEAESIPPKKPRDSITINDILERRAKAGKLVAGTAAYSDSDMFKAPVSQIFFLFLSFPPELQRNMADDTVTVSGETKGEAMGS